MSVRAALPILFASAWLVGCGPQSFEASSTSTDERVGAVSLPIMGGEVDDTSTAVMGIYHAGEGSLCTGSLIAPNVLLTARHCVSSFVDQVGAGVLCSTTKVGTPWTTGGFLVTAATELSFANAGEVFVDEVVELDVDSNLACGHDIAILILRDNVPESRATPLLPRLDAALLQQLGQLGTVVLVLPCP